MARGSSVGRADDLDLRANGHTTDRPECTFAGLTLRQPRLMGIINVTPDSFSDGGEVFEPAAAIRRGLAMLADGADILDIGGESTRPGAEPVAVAEEIARVVPVVAALAAAGALVSVDTRHAAVMGAAITAGARIVNDITALTGDADSLPLVVAAGVAVVLMHMRGEPRTMQHSPYYSDAPQEVHAWLCGRAATCAAAGLAADRIAVDPGIGFGKTVQHNLEILGSLHLYRSLPYALMIGISRKSFIARLCDDEQSSSGKPPAATVAPPAGSQLQHERLPGSLAGALACVWQGAHILRVHDVRATRQALTVWQTIAGISEKG